MTKAPKRMVRLRKENGRPKGTFKKYAFEETRLGFMLKYEVPTVYHIIMRMTPPGVIKEPSVLIIRTVCRASKDPSIQKAKFFRYLKEYAAVGLCCKRPKRLTPERKRYYEGIRRKKLRKFVQENRKRLCKGVCKV